MAKRLILMRHGHAGTARTDHERPLTPWGVEATRSVGRAWVAKGWAPDRVAVSDALRAQETFRAIEEMVGLPATYRADLYHAGVGDLLGVILMTEQRYDTLLVVAHNPGLEDTVGFLSGATPRLAEANAALLTHPASVWEDVASPSTWCCEGVLVPPDSA